jgi:hypothetical protein
MVFLHTQISSVLFFMLCNPTQQSLYTLTWKRWLLYHTTAGVRTDDLLSLIFSSSCALFQTFNFDCDYTPLKCFCKGSMQANQPLALSQLMHSTCYCSAIFPYQALKRRLAQETFIGCVGLHNIKNVKALNIHPVYRSVKPVHIVNRNWHFSYVVYEKPVLHFVSNYLSCCEL